MNAKMIASPADALSAVVRADWDGSSLPGASIWGTRGTFAATRAESYWSEDQARRECVHAGQKPSRD